jgi:tetratricopeptide (TPR) repeat protein
MKLDRTDRAAAELTRLRASDNPSWRSIGESGEALIAGDAGRAIELARRAIEADGGNPFAHYQLGLAAGKASDWGTSVTGFTKAIELKPDLAYAHYYAALAIPGTSVAEMRNTSTHSCASRRRARAWAVRRFWDNK